MKTKMTLLQISMVILLALAIGMWLNMNVPWYYEWECNEWGGRSDAEIAIICERNGQLAYRAEERMGCVSLVRNEEPIPVFLHDCSAFVEVRRRR